MTSTQHEKAVAKARSRRSRYAPPPERPWQPDDWLTLPEAATYARMSWEFLRQACTERRLDHRRDGDTFNAPIKIRRRDLDAFIEELMVRRVQIQPPRHVARP